MGRIAPAPMNAADAETQPPLLVFVPDGPDIAVLLVGTAAEFGIPQRHIRADMARGGYWISDRLADIVYDGAVDDAEQADTQTPDSTETGK